SIGGQNFFVIVDTGSSDLATSSACIASDCKGVHLYLNSPTLRLTTTPFTLRYISGSTSGTIAYETVTFGPFQITSQVFALVNNVANLNLPDTSASGVLGLALPNSAAIPSFAGGGATVTENIFSGLEARRRVFGLRLMREGTGESSLTFGQLDEEVVQNDTALHLVPVHANDGKTYDFWKIPLRFITVNSHLIELSASRVSSSPQHRPLAVFDTGTTLMLGPERDVANVYAQVPSAKREDGQWRVDCVEVVWLGVGFGPGEGVGGGSPVYWMHPLDVSWDEGNGGRRTGRCLGGVQVNEDVSSGDWLFGDTFLRVRELLSHLSFLNNVYLAHYGHNSTMSPTVGLLGLTDPHTALAEFAQRRDVPNPANLSTLLPALDIPSDSSLPALYYRPEHTLVWTDGLILALACLAGFVVGMGISVLFQAPRVQTFRRLRRL
ncbi:hypothetical protein BOTBODRAFT_107388, partial [Botryobasidium botryosum FD-172 SS1]